MLGTLSLALLLASHRPTASLDSYAPIKEAFGSLVSFLKEAQPNAHFHGGASLLGGVINPNGQFTYRITTHDAGDHVIILAGENGASTLDVDVVDSKGKSVVADRVKGKVAAATFKGRNPETFTVIAKNTAKSGDGKFGALAIIVEQGGVTYPLNAITKVVNKMSSAIQTGFEKGYGITPNEPFILGNLMETGSAYNRTGRLGGERWLAIVTSDVSPLTIDVNFLDKAKSFVSPEEVSESASRLYGLKKLANSMQMKNSGQKRALAFTGIMD